MHNRFIIILLFNILALILSIYLESRSFTLGNLGALLFVTVHVRREKITLKSLTVLAVVASIVLLSLVFGFKTGSSSGRILIYKISWNMFKDHVCTGVGLGNFKLSYLHYQAAYFKDSIYSEKEMLLADNTYFAFNDYWQLVVETGMMGALFFSIFLLFFAQIVRRSYMMNLDNTFLIFCVAQLLTIVVAALFTHVFEKIFFQSIALFLIGGIITYGFKRPYNKKVISVLIVTVIFVNIIYHYRHKIFYYDSFRKFEYAQDLIGQGYHTESLEILREIYTDCKVDFNYLQLYGKRLQINGDYQQSIPVLEQAVKVRTNSELLSILADSYIKTERYQLAEQVIKHAVYMVPNRFSSRYKLFQIYLKNGNKVAAIKCGEEILALPVKIPSIRVDRIRSEVKEALLSI